MDIAIAAGLMIISSGILYMIGKKLLSFVKAKIIKSENKYDDYLLQFEDEAEDALNKYLKILKEKLEDAKKKEDGKEN